MITVAKKLAEKEWMEKIPFRPIKTTQPNPPMRPLPHRMRFGP